MLTEKVCAFSLKVSQFYVTLAVLRAGDRTLVPTYRCFAIKARFVFPRACPLKFSRGRNFMIVKIRESRMYVYLNK